jgi:1,4-alpha-glucan branching enzyme
MATRTLTRPSAKTAQKRKTPQTVEFRFYAPLSKKVALGGDFNNWNAKKNPLKPSKTGLWSTTIKLKPGRYQYRFTVDGKWENDNQRQTEIVGNGLGQVNNVLVVG